MVKIFFLILLLTYGVMGQSAVVSQVDNSFLTTLTPQEHEWLHSHPTITVNNLIDWPPFDFTQNGKAAGLGIDYVELIAQKAGFKVAYVNGTWEEQLSRFKSGEIDVLHSIYYTDERNAYMLFTKPFYINHIAMAVPKESDIKTVADLAGKKVAMIKGFGTTEILLQSVPTIKPIMVNNLYEGLRAVSFKQADAVVDNIAAMSYVLMEQPLANLHVESISIPGDEAFANLYFGTSKENKVLNSILQKGMDSITSDEHTAIRKRWIPIETVSPFDYTRLLQGLGGAFLALVALFYWNYLLKRQVSRKTNELSTLLHSFNTHVIASKTDLHGNITYVSDAFCRINGYAREELIGKNHRIVKYPNNPSEAYKPMWETITHGGVWQGKVKNSKKEGGYYWVDSVVEPEYDTAGTLIGYTSIRHDITAQQELEELSRTLEETIAERTSELALLNQEQQAIFDSTSVGIVLLRNRLIVQTNTRADQMFGYDRGEQIGSPTAIWYLEEIDVSSVYTTMGEGKIATWEQQLKRKDGTLFWARINGKYIDQNEPEKGVVAVIEDMSEQRQALEEIQNAKQIAEEATKAKSHFLANMSHEIRTPMNAIIGMSHLALETELSAQQRNYIEKVDNAAKNLLGIINDILDFSKIEAGKMVFEKIDFYFEDIMDDLADMFVAKTQEKGIELLFDIEPSVPTALIGDPLRLAQVLINLVSNAVKFTHTGEIILSVKMLSQSEQEVHLRFGVKDTGIGLTPEQISKLFSAFTQADSSTTRKYGGSGLGLTICQHIITMMEGEIGVESEYQHGSEFYFTVKLGIQSEQRNYLDESKNLEGLRVLIADDNSSAREILRNMIASFGFDVNTVSSGKEAIEELENGVQQKQPYGLVIMDWMMPEMDGVQTIQQIRHQENLSQIPAFIMVTAYSRDELLVQMDTMSVEGILTKPVNPSCLYETILGAFGTKMVHHLKSRLKSSDYKEITKSLAGAHLLLVEDNILNQGLAIELLEKVDVKVDIAQNGVEAIEKIQTNRYDGILMDCQMPIMDGFEATEMIRKDERFRDLPIIAMTANAMSGDKERCIVSGMNDHIAKPLDVVKFFKTLSEWIQPSTHFERIDNRHDETNVQILGMSIDGLDLSEALDRMAGDQNLLIKMLKRFAQTQGDFPHKLRKAIEEENLEEAIREVHSLKGLLGNIGAKRMYKELQEFEKNLKSSTMHSLDGVIAKIEKVLNILIDNIGETLEKIENLSDKKIEVASSSIDKRTLVQEITTLRKMLEDLDADALDESHILVSKLRSLGFEKEMNLFENALQNFDFETANGYLENILDNLAMG